MDLVDLRQVVEISPPTKPLGLVYQLFAHWQMQKLNEKGYWFLNFRQLSYVYGKKIYNESLMKFNLRNYLKLKPVEKQKTVEIEN